MENYKETYKSICRICLNYGKSQSMVSLIDENASDGISCYGKAVQNFANISIEKHDKLPSVMCVKCLYLLKQSIRFKMICESSDKSLRKVVNIVGDDIERIKEKIVEYTMLKFYFPHEQLKTLHKTVETKRKKQILINSSKKSDVLPEKVNKEVDLVDHFDIQSDIEEETQTEDDLLNKMQRLIENNCFNSSIKITKHFKKKHLKFKKKLVKRQKILTIQKSREERKNIKLVCNICNKVLANQHTYEYHMQRHNGCSKESDVLSEKVNKEVDLVDHFDIQSDIEEETQNEDDLLNKMERLIENNCFNSSIKITKPFKKKHLKFKKKLVKRQKNLTIQKSREERKNIKLVCNICNKVLANQHTYEYHMQRHNGCRYICEHCGKGFPVRTELQIHQVSRHGTGPHFQCSQCPFKAPRKFDLIEHERLHSGERPYTCEKCGLTFRRRGIWRKHLIYHTEKKIQCPQCPRKFFQRSEMLAHANNIHDRVYVYLCNKCGATYAKTATVRRHMTDRHGIPREMQGKIIRVNKGIHYQEQ